ncbi:glycosyltransferase, partial [Methylobacterium sp. WL9]
YVAGEPLRLLAIGTIEPRKDYGAAVALTAALVAAGIPAELHIVGRVGWGRQTFLDAPPAFLTLHGYLDDSGLRSLAGRCHLLLSTAKAEGLGLPLLEIQHGGLPVVAPTGPVFAEVLGRSGLFIRPEDPEGSARALIGFARDGSLASAAAASRGNVARWNALAAADAIRFHRFLGEGASAYGGDPAAIVPPA